MVQEFRSHFLVSKKPFWLRKSRFLAQIRLFGGSLAKAGTTAGRSNFVLTSKKVRAPPCEATKCRIESGEVFGGNALMMECNACKKSHIMFNFCKVVTYALLFRNGNYIRKYHQKFCLMIKTLS